MGHCLGPQARSSHRGAHLTALNPAAHCKYLCHVLHNTGHRSKMSQFISESPWKWKKEKRKHRKTVESGADLILNNWTRLHSRSSLPSHLLALPVKVSSVPVEFNRIIWDTVGGSQRTWREPKDTHRKAPGIWQGPSWCDATVLTSKIHWSWRQPATWGVSMRFLVRPNSSPKLLLSSVLNAGASSLSQ